jgi:ABC-type branched-subunit amino acid transport system substrate-binding protein
MVEGSFSAPQGTPFPEVQASADAAVKYINAHGGAGGHKLILDTCDDQFNAAGVQHCAQQAISNHDVACVGCTPETGLDPLVQILASQHIPAFGILAGSKLDGTSPDSFPIAEGLLDVGGSGLAATPKYGGCHKTNMMVLTFPGNSVYINIVKKAMAQAGDKLGTVTQIPFAASDYTAQVVQALSDHPDCLVAGMLPANFAAIMPVLKSLGDTNGVPRIFTTRNNIHTSQCANPAFSTSVCKGFTVLSPFPAYTSPVYDTMKAALKTYGEPNLDYATENGISAWAGMLALADVMKSVKGPVTGETIGKAASQASAVSTGGILPPLNFSTEFSNPQYSRIFNRSESGQVWSPTANDFVPGTGPLTGQLDLSGALQ